jgi:hypothetical protein
MSDNVHHVDDAPVNRASIIATVVRHTDGSFSVKHRCADGYEESARLWKDNQAAWRGQLQQLFERIEARAR